MKTLYFIIIAAAITRCRYTKDHLRISTFATVTFVRKSRIKDDHLANFQMWETSKQSSKPPPPQEQISYGNIFSANKIAVETFASAS